MSELPPHRDDAEEIPEIAPETPLAVVGPELTPAPPPQPRFRAWVTLLCTLIMALLLGALLLAPLAPNAEWAQGLAAPPLRVETMERVLGIGLDWEAFAAERPVWERLLIGSPDADVGGTLKESIQAYQSLPVDRRDERTRRTLVVLLAEARRWNELDRELAALERMERTAEFVRAIRHAYQGRPDRLSVVELDTAVDWLRPAWARDTLRLRVAERDGDLARAAAARSELRARGRQLYLKLAPFGGLQVGLMVLSLALIASWIRGGRAAASRIANGLRVPPWRLREGYAVLVRAEMLGFCVAIAIYFWLRESPLGSVLTTLGFYGLSVWYCARMLLRPRGLHLSATLGLSAPAPQLVNGLRIALVILGLDMIGSLAVESVSTMAGFSLPWSDFVQEMLMYGSWPEAAADAFSAVIAAPIAEEILCRGFLYVSLRRRFSPLPAAAASAVLFALPHLYSVPGLLEVAWSGFLLAVAYERCGSLIPGILCHAAMNAMSVAMILSAYRP